MTRKKTEKKTEGYYHYLDLTPRLCRDPSKDPNQKYNLWGVCDYMDSEVEEKDQFATRKEAEQRIIEWLKENPYGKFELWKFTGKYYPEEKRYSKKTFIADYQRCKIRGEDRLEYRYKWKVGKKIYE